MSIRLSATRPRAEALSPFDYQRHFERWEWLHNGCWLIGQTAWLLVPFLLGLSLIPTLSVVAAALVTTHGFAHLLGVRSMVRGIDGLTFEEGDPVSAARIAWQTALVHAVVGSLVLLGLMGTCLTSVVAGPIHLVLPAIAVTSGIVAIAAVRFAGVALADSLGIREELFLERIGTIVTLAAAGLWIVALGLLLAAPGMSMGGALVLAVGPFAAIAVLAALAFHRDLFLRIAVAVPQLEAFNEAAARAARTKPVPLPRASTSSIDDLPPIEVADLPPKDSGHRR